MPAELAIAQWELVAAELVRRGFSDTVAEALDSRTGGMDTLTRGDVLEAWAALVVGTAWPLNSTPDKVSGDFFEAFGLHLRSLGATRLDVSKDQT